MYVYGMCVLDLCAYLQWTVSVVSLRLFSAYDGGLYVQCTHRLVYTPAHSCECLCNQLMHVCVCKCVCVCSQQVTQGSTQNGLLVSAVWIILRPVPRNLFCSCPGNSSVYIITSLNTLMPASYSHCAVILAVLASRYLQRLLMMD